MGLFGIGTHNNARIAQGLDYENFRSQALENDKIDYLQKTAPGIAPPLKRFGRSLPKKSIPNRRDCQQKSFEATPNPSRSYTTIHSSVKR